MQNPVELHSSCRRPISISAAVDIFDQTDLFDYLDNARIVELSRMGGQPGFSTTESVRKSTGISVRRIMKPDIATIDVAMALCEKVLLQTGRSVQEFPSIYLCHSHTDPAQCQILGKQLTVRLGLEADQLTPFNHGCCGFLKLLHDAVLHLEESETEDSILLLSVETPESWHDGSDRLFCGIVSAGATAVVLERSPGLPLATVRAEDFLIPTERRPNPLPLFRKEHTDVYSFRGEACRRTVMRMNSEPVFLNGIELMLNNLRSALDAIDRQPGQRVVVAPHQPSGKLLRALVAAARTEFPDLEFLNNLDQYGNTISSSVPTILSRLPEVLVANQLKPLRDGDHLILLAAGICMDEIADHMTAGHACINWVGEMPGHNLHKLTEHAQPIS